MGVVYLAEQRAPIHRRAALKVIKLGMDTKHVVARFEAERQALALMDHPGIAKVFDVGTTPEGRPYFAMEYVRGIPITSYCDRRQFGTRHRVELLAHVCEAVHHAHQKGIIHRDVKPSNVLVADGATGPEPKIIDFGVAKALSRRLTEKTVDTALGQIVGTLDYMSPEQADLTALDVDTRSDVYSLGVLLYELLTGVLPFDPEELRRGGFEGFVRTIRETQPRRPSTRVAALEQPVAEGVARQRQTDARALARRLRGDLNWIVMKALEKDRERRYASASEMAQDLRRHLRHEPVVASPPSARYRASRFVRRHRLGVAFAATVLVLLASLAASLALQARRIAAERDRANQQAETARQVSDFMVDLFRVADPTEARANTITAREILDRGAARIEGEILGGPLVKARLMDTMGRVYQNLSLFDSAGRLLEGALTIRRGTPGVDGTEIGASLRQLGSLRALQGLGSEAEPLLREALAIHEQALGPSHVETAWDLYYLSWIGLWGGGADADEVKGYLDRAASIFRKETGRARIGLAWCLNDLAGQAQAAGELESAKRLFEEALRIKEELLGAEDPDVAITLEGLANVQKDLGNYEEARSCYERAIRVGRKSLGDDHWRVGLALSNLAILSARLGRPDDAGPLFARAVSGLEKTLGPSHFVVLYQRACFHAVLRESEVAVRLLREANREGALDERLQNDSDLDSLRGDPRFEALVTEARARLTAAPR